MTPRALEARFQVTVGGGASVRPFSLDAALRLEEGVLVLFGASGVGKTLTLKALAGLLPGVHGEVRVSGSVLLDSARHIDVPADERRVGYVPQQQALFPFVDVTGNVGFGLPRAERRGPRVQAIIDELGLTTLASARVDSLSGGERQRVALGRALAIEPRLLLLDEPFASIDRTGRDALQRVLRASIDRRGIPAVLVTHDADEARALGDHVVRFARGRTEAHGPPTVILPRATFTLAGTRAGDVDDVGDDRERIALRDVTVEGPKGALRRRGDADTTLELELVAPTRVDD